MTKENMIEIGGIEWVKNSMHRVYLNQDAICKLINLDESKLSAMEIKSIKKSKTFFDCKTSEVKSDVGTVRCLLNQYNVNCVK